jgi:hypothetical protein
MRDARSPLARVIYRYISKNVTRYVTHRLAFDESTAIKGV